jgi:hypothetical protein
MELSYLELPVSRGFAVSYHIITSSVALPLTSYEAPLVLAEQTMTRASKQCKLTGGPWGTFAHVDAERAAVKRKLAVREAARIACLESIVEM